MTAGLNWQFQTGYQSNYNMNYGVNYGPQNYFAGAPATNVGLPLMESPLGAYLEGLQGFEQYSNADPYGLNFTNQQPLQMQYQNNGYIGNPYQQPYQQQQQYAPQNTMPYYPQQQQQFMPQQQQNPMMQMMMMMMQMMMQMMGMAAQQQQGQNQGLNPQQQAQKALDEAVAQKMGVAPHPGLAQSQGVNSMQDLNNPNLPFNQRMNQQNQQNQMMQNPMMQMMMQFMQMMMMMLMRMMGINPEQMQQAMGQNPAMGGQQGAYAGAGSNGAYANAGVGPNGAYANAGTGNNNTVNNQPFNNGINTIPANKPDYIANSDWSKIKQLNPKMQSAVCKLYERAHEKGLNFHISSGFRSHEQQTHIYNTARPGYAAKPGSSQHEFGNAIDIQASTATKHELGNIWKNEMGLKWGQTFSKAEDWHFDIRSA